jgi:uncharacterized protein
MANDRTFISFDVEITRKCNLACRYCYLGQKPSTATMSKETLDQTVAFVSRVYQRNRMTHINLYGGEAILAWREMTYLIEEIEAAKVPCGFTLLTNGITASKEIAAYCRAHRITVARSIDGCLEALALNRPGVAEAYKAAGEFFQDHHRTRRSTVSPEAAKYLFKSLLFLHEDLGLALGGCWIPDLYVEWSPEHIKDFVDQLWEVGRFYVQKCKEGKAFPYHWIDRAKSSLNLKLPKKLFGCGAGRGMIAINWEGYLYPCHRFCTEPSDSPICGGHVSDADLRQPEFGENWQQYLSFLEKNEHPPACDGCIAKPGCGWGCCHVNYKVNHGDFLTQEPLWCTFRRASVELVQWINEQLKDTNPAWYMDPPRQRRVQQRPSQQQRGRQMVGQRRPQPKVGGQCQCGNNHQRQVAAGSKQPQQPACQQQQQQQPQAEQQPCPYN